MERPDGEVINGIDSGLEDGSQAVLLDLDPNLSLEFLEKAALLSGKPVPSQVPREELVRVHNEALAKFVKDQKAPRPVKKVSLSLAYAASTKSLNELDKLLLKDMLVEMHHEDKLLVLRTITESYPGVGAVAIVEDETGDAHKLAVYNQTDASILSAPPEGSILAVKEPYLQFNGGEDFMICVDHPSDILLLDPDSPVVPLAFQTDSEEPDGQTSSTWVMKGDKAFIARNLPEAIRCYSKALAAVPSHDKASRTNILFKRARTNLMVKCYDSALEDSLASRDGGDGDWKALQVAARAAYQLQRFPESTNYLQAALEQNPSDASLKKEHERCLARMRESEEGAYDFARLAKLVNRRNNHLDVANFTRKTEIRESPCHGRGLFATCDIQPGEVIFCEKATCLPNEYNVKHNSAALYANMVEQCQNNPSLHARTLDLYEGKYKRSGREGERVDGTPVVDVFLLESIRRANSFMSPRHSREAALAGWTMERDGMARGMWPHAAYANHACWQNSVRAFVGDVLVSRATEPIRAGAEILHVYLPPKAVYPARDQQFAQWGFRCRCRLCAAEARSPAERHARRRDALLEVSDVILKQGEKKKKQQQQQQQQPPPPALVPQSTVRAVEKLTKKLEDLHEEAVYGRLPRLALVWPTMWLLEAYSGQRNHRKTLKWAAQVLRNFGFFSPASSLPGAAPGSWDIFAGPSSASSSSEAEAGAAAGGGGILSFEALKALTRAREAHKALGDDAAARACHDAARRGWMTMTGFDSGGEGEDDDPAAQAPAGWVGEEFKGAAAA